MLRLICIAATGALAAVSAFAQPLEFKGTPMGVTVAKFAAQHPEFDCTSASGPLANCMVGSYSCPDRAPTCHGAEIFTTYAGENARNIFVRFIDGSMSQVQITIAPVSASIVMLALAKKYGPPTKLAQPVMSNRMGATAAGLTGDWSLRDGSQIHVERYAESLDKGMIVLTAATMVAREKAERAQSESKRKSDL